MKKMSKNLIEKAHRPSFLSINDLPNCCPLHPNDRTEKESCYEKIFDDYYMGRKAVYIHCVEVSDDFLILDDETGEVLYFNEDYKEDILEWLNDNIVRDVFDELIKTLYPNEN